MRDTNRKCNVKKAGPNSQHESCGDTNDSVNIPLTECGDGRRDIHKSILRNCTGLHKLAPAADQPTECASVWLSLEYCDCGPTVILSQENVPGLQKNRLPLSRMAHSICSMGNDMLQKEYMSQTSKS